MFQARLEPGLASAFKLHPSPLHELRLLAQIGIGMNERGLMFYTNIEGLIGAEKKHLSYLHRLIGMYECIILCLPKQITQSFK